MLLSTRLLAASPAFECSDGTSTQYSVWLTPQKKTLSVKSGGGTREYLLSEPNLGVAVPGDAPLYYVGHLPQGKTPYSMHQMGTMVRTHYYQDAGKSFASVDIVLDHSSIRNLLCRTSIASVPVVPVSAKTALPQRLLEPMRLWGGKVEGPGKLSPLSLLATEATLLQFHHSEKANDPKFMQEFADAAGNDIRKIPPRSVETLKTRLGLKEKEFLDRVLDACRYRYYPEVQRYADWVAEGMGRKSLSGQPAPDWDQVKSALAAFFESKAFQASDLRAFFTAEIAKSVPALSAFDLLRLTANQKEDRERFLLKAWGANQTDVYNKLKPAFVRLNAMEHNLTRPLKPEEAGQRSHFAEFVNHFSQLIRVAQFDEPAVRGALRERILPQVDRLNAREKKSLFELLPEPERKAFDSLRAEPARELSSP